MRNLSGSDLLAVEDLEGFFCTSATGIRRLASSGRLKTVRIGRLLFIRKDSVIPGMISWSRPRPISTDDYRELERFERELNDHLLRKSQSAKNHSKKRRVMTTDAAVYVGPYSAEIDPVEPRANEKLLRQTPQHQL